VASSEVQNPTALRITSPYTHIVHTPKRHITPTSQPQKIEVSFVNMNVDARNDMHATTITNNPEVHEGQYFGRNSALGGQVAWEPCDQLQQACAPVKDHIAAWESNIMRFDRNAKRTTALYNVSQDGDVVSDGDDADWYQRSPSRVYMQQNRDRTCSEALSSADSGATQSLDGRKKNRDIANRDALRHIETH
jgi:hypothetical protein